MGDEHVELLERPFVQQQFDPLARGQLPPGVLGIDTTLATALSRRGATRLEFRQNVFHRLLPGSRRSAHHSGEGPRDKGEFRKFAIF